MPAMWPNCRSSGVATEDAMIWALRAGQAGLHLMVGKVDLGQRSDGQHR